MKWFCCAHPHRPAFHFDAYPYPAFTSSDPDPVFHFDADPDLASQNYEDPDFSLIATANPVTLFSPYG
jgi:hypothetical protein